MQKNWIRTVSPLISLVWMLTGHQVCQAQLTLSSSTKQIHQRVEVKPTKIKRIDPGTAIGDTAPNGWTYMLFKNESKIGTGDMDSASSLSKNLVSLFGSVMVANVVPNATETKYILAEIGYGLYTKIDAKNVIVSSDTYKQLGAQLGILQSVGLSQAEARVEQLAIKARTDSMAVVDSKSMVVLNGKHQEVMVRHAILLNQQTGRVLTLIWFFLPTGANKPGIILSEMDCFEHNSHMDLVVHIDRREFTLGLIAEKALALDKMTWGPKQVPIPKELEPLARLPLFTADSLVLLENGLLQVVAP